MKKDKMKELYAVKENKAQLQKVLDAIFLEGIDPELSLSISIKETKDTNPPSYMREIFGMPDIGPIKAVTERSLNIPINQSEVEALIRALFYTAEKRERKIRRDIENEILCREQERGNEPRNTPLSI